MESKMDKKPNTICKESRFLPWSKFKEIDNIIEKTYNIKLSKQIISLLTYFRCQY